MDYIILWATSRLSGLKPHHARIAVASLMGAAYAVGYLCFQGSALFSLTGKIVVSVILVTLAIKPARWQDYSKILLYFYLSNFTLAGATISLSSLLPGTGSVQLFPAIWIVLAVLAALSIWMFAGRYFKEQLMPVLLIFPVLMSFGNQH